MVGTKSETKPSLHFAVIMQSCYGYPVLSGLGSGGCRILWCQQHGLIVYVPQ